MEGKKKKSCRNQEMKSTQPRTFKRLEHPSGRVDVVLDTDTFNEIDDRSLHWLIWSAQRKIGSSGCLCGSVLKWKAKDPAEGMEKATRKSLHILDINGERWSEACGLPEDQRLSFRQKQNRFFQKRLGPLLKEQWSTQREKTIVL